MENSFKILPLGLYVHYPFCIRKCPYCDFNSYGEGSDSDRDILYFRRLKTDFSKALEEQNLKGRRFKSVYIGGGTPSLADTDLISEFLNFISGSLDSSVEISMECNPGTVDLNKLKAIKAAGVNRLSIGVQSFNSASLKRLGRIHDAESAKNAVESAVKAGFTDLNVDLMHGLPNQTASEALSDLKQALELGATHLSWYELTIEEDTKFGRHPPVLPSEDELADIEKEGFAFLSSSGFVHYEVSVFYKNKPCLHNLNYWNFGDYLGIGAGAHSKLFRDGQTLRRAQTERPADYMQRKDAAFSAVPASDVPFEFMLNRLRIFNEIAASEFTQTTALPFSMVEKQLHKAESKGLVEFTENGYRISQLGRLMLNDVLELFLPNCD